MDNIDVLRKAIRDAQMDRKIFIKYMLLVNHPAVTWQDLIDSFDIEGPHRFAALCILNKNLGTAFDLQQLKDAYNKEFWIHLVKEKGHNLNSEAHQ